MKKCKKCKAIISLDLPDIINGAIAPKCVNAESINLGLCKECFDKREDSGFTRINNKEYIEKVTCKNWDKEIKRLVNKNPSILRIEIDKALALHMKLNH